MNPLSNAERRQLKARAQKLEAILKVGHAGITPAFVTSLDGALTTHGLVKIRFSDFKDEKKTLAPNLAAKTGSELIARVGNVAVYYRPKPQVSPEPEPDTGPGRSAARRGEVS